MFALILKAIVVFFVIAAAETLHGIWRIRFLNYRLGDWLSRQLGVITGSIFLFVIAWLFFPWLAAENSRECLIIGSLWFVLMLCFDIGFGRFVFHLSWKRILADFDLTKGNFLILGMLFLLFTPLLIYKLRAGF